MSRWSEASAHIAHAEATLFAAEEAAEARLDDAELAVFDVLRSIAHSQLALAQIARMSAAARPL